MQIGFYQAINNRMIFQYGVNEDHLLPWHIWNNGVTQFWDALHFDEKTAFMCENCGPMPDNLCMDGVCIGMASDKIKGENRSDLVLEYSDKPTLDAPNYKERMFISQKKNRDLVKKIVTNETFPNLDKTKFDNDFGMKKVTDFLSEVKSEGNKTLPKEYRNILNDLCSVSSTISIFQVANTSLMQCIKSKLIDSNTNLITDPRTLKLKQRMFLEFPLLFKRLEDISKCNSSGRLPQSVRKLYASILEFCLEY